MPNEMIERVAKSLYGGDWDILSRREGYCHLAKLAITAMREPTDKMINAAGAQSPAWSKMIDAALKDD